MDITYAPMQMSGLYDFTKYKALIASVSDTAKDVAATRDIMVKMRSSSLSCVESPTLACMLDAAQSIAVGMARVTQAPIGTTDPMLWLTMRDCVISANRLLAVPEFDGRLGCSVYELIYSVATMLDLVGRLADVGQVKSFEHVDMADVNKRVATIFVDIACGRGTAWLGYIDDMGCVACLGGDVSWLRLRDRFASARANECLKQIISAMGMDADTASRMWVTEVLGLAEVFDIWQSKCMRRDTGRVRVQLDPERLAAAIRPDVFTQVMDHLVMPDAGSAQLSGYCRTFSMSPIGAVMNVTTAFEKEAMSTYHVLRAKKMLDKL